MDEWNSFRGGAGSNWGPLPAAGGRTSGSR